MRLTNNNRNNKPMLPNLKSENEASISGDKGKKNKKKTRNIQNPRTEMNWNNFCNICSSSSQTFFVRKTFLLGFWTFRFISLILSSFWIDISCGHMNPIRSHHQLLLHPSIRHGNVQYPTTGAAYSMGRRTDLAYSMGIL